MGAVFGSLRITFVACFDLFVRNLMINEFLVVNGGWNYLISCVLSSLSPCTNI